MTRLNERAERDARAAAGAVPPAEHLEHVAGDRDELQRMHAELKRGLEKGSGDSILIDAQVMDRMLTVLERRLGELHGLLERDLDINRSVADLDARIQREVAAHIGLPPGALRLQALLFELDGGRRPNVTVMPGCKPSKLDWSMVDVEWECQYCLAANGWVCEGDMGLAIAQALDKRGGHEHWCAGVAE